ncbi:MAG TPA: hypothetical protein VLH10_02340, partial [Yinghuangia sp.]|nr:hypothetical protein [Yinghuangia sp.]
MSRGRHRQSSALLRISVLIAVLAPAFVAVVLAAVGSGTGVLRVAALCAAASAVALVVLLRQSRRNYGEDLARHRRDREQLAVAEAEIRAAHEKTLARTAAQERQMAAARERVAAIRARLTEAEARVAGAEARAGEARKHAEEADRRIAVAQARARQAEDRLGEAAVRVRELEARAEELTARVAELQAGAGTTAPRPVRLTAELFAGGAAVLRSLEKSAAAKAKAEAEARAHAMAEAVTEAASAEPVPLVPRPVVPAARFLRPRPESVPEMGPESHGSEVREPVGEQTAEPVAEPVAASVGNLPVPRTRAEVVAPGEPAAEEAAAELDFGVDALEPAVAALPPDEAVALIMRDVVETVRAVRERMARAADGSSFDFFGRGEIGGEEAGDGMEPVAETESDAGVAAGPERPELEEAEPEDRAAATVGSGAQAVEAPVSAGEDAFVESRAHRVVRDASARFEIATARPLVTHEPRTGRAIPVDLTAHD